VEYGLFVGPRLARVPIGRDALRVNLIPLGEYVKLPARKREDGTGECAVSTARQALVALASILSLAAIALVACWVAGVGVWAAMVAIVCESASVVGLATGTVTWDTVRATPFAIVFAHVALGFTLVNLLPLRLGPVGHLIGMAVPWFRSGIVLVLSLLVLVAVMVVGVVGIVW
jgi:hypothetical protein